jgi:hypothetical protein
VDRHYRKHPWTETGSRQVSASSAKPPLEHPDGQQIQWVMAQPVGPSDSEGWQYALDFVSSDSSWGSSASLCHVRRRLWRSQKVVDVNCDVASDSEPEDTDAKVASGVGFTTFACALSAFMAALLQLWLHWEAMRGLAVGSSSRCILAVCLVLSLLCSGRRRQIALRGHRCVTSGGCAVKVRNAWRAKVGRSWRSPVEPGGWADEDDIENRWSLVAHEGELRRAETC